MSHHRFFPYLVLLFGVLIAATSSILVRLAQANGTPSLVVTSWRLIFAAIILTPIAWQRRGPELRYLQRKDVVFGAVAGVFLAAHLATWIYSLEFTSVASSAALVSTNPLWIALAAFIFWGERPSRYTIIGVAAAIIGSTLIAFSDGGVLTIGPGTMPTIQFNWQKLMAPAGKADTALWGDILALVGAMTGSAYLLVGRTLRARLSTIAYVWLAYFVAMITMLMVTSLVGLSLFGYPWQAYLWILLLALGPQLLGHTSFNWALAHLSTTFVALSILGEPVGSAIFAYFLFGETFASIQLLGFVLLLVGIGMGALGEQTSADSGSYH
ncbi:MAG: DMT family transporter [Anaerolineae bacterium]|nr:DMT family transporter [Anaerolineae bacterium]